MYTAFFRGGYANSYQKPPPKVKLNILQNIFYNGPSVHQRYGSQLQHKLNCKISPWLPRIACRQGMVMIIRKPLVNLVEQNCDYFVSDQCLGTNVNGGRLKRESETTIIYQYPYAFEYQNAGLCWIQAGMPCDYFEKYILPLNSEFIDEYNELVRYAIDVGSKFCSCGREIGINERKCVTCKAKTRRLRNRRFRLVD